MFNVINRARRLMGALWLFMFKQWTMMRTCDACWSAPSPETNPEGEPPSAPPVLLSATRARKELPTSSSDTPTGSNSSGRQAGIVATLQGVIDWSMRQSIRELLQRVTSPDFLRSLTGATVLRFASWQRIDAAPPSTWSDRPKPTDADVDSTHGVPLEVMVDVANQSERDPWFCMPHWADDAYVRSFAELVKERLDPERVVYVEHSNDVGNEDLPQHHYLCATAAAAVARFGADASKGALKCHVARSLDIVRIWREVFGDRARVVGVLGISGAEEGILSDLLSLEPVRESFDAVVLGPILDGITGEASDAAQSLCELSTSTLAELKGVLGQCAELAAASGKRVFACITEPSPSQPE